MMLRLNTIMIDVNNCLREHICNIYCLKHIIELLLMMCLNKYVQ